MTRVVDPKRGKTCLGTTPIKGRDPEKHIITTSIGVGRPQNGRTAVPAAPTSLRGAGEGEAGDPAVESARGRGEIDRAPRALMGEGPRDRDPDPEPEAGTNTMLPNPMNIPK